MIVRPVALLQFPQPRGWVFLIGNYPSLLRLLAAHRATTHSQQSMGPSPSGTPFEHTSAAAPRQRSESFCSDPVQEYYSPIRILAWYQPKLRSRLYSHLPPGGSRPTFVFSVPHPFVCECHNISAIPPARTIPGLPGSHSPLPHRVARKHLGTTGWNPNAFASILQARPLPAFGRPVHPRDRSLRLQPGGSPQALQTPPRGERPALRSFPAPASEELPPPSDIDPGRRVEWDSNPPETCAARHTLCLLLPSPRPSRHIAMPVAGLPRSAGLVSGSCSWSPGFASAFLQTLPRGNALALG